MRRSPPLNSHGQSMVEMVLLLPVFFFLSALLFQGIYLGRDAIAVQEKVAERARQAALKENPSSSNTREGIQPARRFKGVEVSRTYGFIERQEMHLLRRSITFFHWRLPAFSLHFTAVYPGESALPRSSS